MKKIEHIIKKIEAGSIAEEMEIEEGERNNSFQKSQAVARCTRYGRRQRLWYSLRHDNVFATIILWLTWHGIIA